MKLENKRKRLNKKIEKLEKKLSDLKYCGNCGHLNNTEKKENKLRQKDITILGFHYCYKYNSRVYHNTNHPNIERCSICDY